MPGDAYNLAVVGGLVTNKIVFTGPPPAGASCDVRIVTSDDDNKTLEVVSYTTATPFDGIQSNFLLSPDDTGIDNTNSFIFLSGVAQMPLGSGHPTPAYTIVSLGITSTLSFVSGAPQNGLSYDFRAILSGPAYRNAAFPSVYIISADDISGYFDNITTSFPLYINNVPIDSNIVNAENMFVTLGAVIQIPHNVDGDPLSGNAYTVQVNAITNLLEITFAEPPLIGTTCNIRIIANQEIIVCPLPTILAGGTVLRAGDGIIANEQGQIVQIESGLIGP